MVEFARYVKAASAQNSNLPTLTDIQFFYDAEKNQFTFFDLTRGGLAFDVRELDVLVELLKIYESVGQKSIEIKQKSEEIQSIVKDLNEAKKTNKVTKFSKFKKQ